MSERKILRLAPWHAHDEARLDAYLTAHTEVDLGDVRGALGFSPSKTVKMRAWKDHRARRAATKRPRQIKERPLNRAMLEVHADQNAVDPEMAVMNREQVFRTILEFISTEARAHVNRLPQSDQETLCDYVLQNVDVTQNRDPQETRSLIVEVAGSWLEEQEQDDRRQRRQARRR